MAGIPNNIVLRTLTPETRKVSNPNGRPMISTRSDLRSGLDESSSGGGSGGTGALTYAVSGSTLSITTDGTYNFGTKPTGPKPLAVWTGGDGSTPNATLGRVSEWSKAGQGQISTTLAGPGNTQSWLHDAFDSSGTMHSEQNFASDQLYVFRRYYDDHTYEGAMAYRSRVALPLLSGSLPVPGDTVTGETSGATGVVVEAVQDSATRASIFFDNKQGTISNATPTDFQYQEVMTWAGGSGTNDEVAGLYRTYNNKIFRLWNKVDGNNILMGEAPTGDKVTPERTEGSFDGNDWDNPEVGAFTPYVWINDEWVYQTGTIDTMDGIFWRYKDGVKGYEAKRFIMRTTSYPGQYSLVAHHQVSNGAQPGADRYYDLIYIDEDWCRVVLMDGPDLRLNLNDGLAIQRKVVPCPVITWSASEITCHDWRKYLPTATHLGVINSSNVLVGSVAL